MDDLEGIIIPINSSYFSMPSAFMSYGIGVNVINFILCLPSNGYMLWLILTSADSAMALEFFSLNLAVSEMLFGLSNICTFVYYIYKSLLALQVTVFFASFLFIGRPLFQMCICVERYLAVVHPVFFLRLKTLRWRVVCCSGVWLLVITACVASLLMTLTTTQLLIMGFYIVMISVKLFCSLSILWALKKPGPGGRRGKTQRSSDVKMKAFKVILVITASTIVTYLPFIIVFILYFCIAKEEFQMSYMICASLAMLTGFVHPLLYFHRTGNLPCVSA